MVLGPSGTTEAVLFLRGPVNGEVKGPQVFNLLWNHTDKAVILNVGSTNDVLDLETPTRSLTTRIAVGSVALLETVAMASNCGSNIFR